MEGGIRKRWVKVGFIIAVLLLFGFFLIGKPTTCDIGAEINAPSTILRADDASVFPVNLKLTNNGGSVQITQIGLRYPFSFDFTVYTDPSEPTQFYRRPYSAFPKKSDMTIPLSLFKAGSSGQSENLIINVEACENVNYENGRFAGATNCCFASPSKVINFGTQ